MLCHIDKCFIRSHPSLCHSYPPPPPRPKTHEILCLYILLLFYNLQLQLILDYLFILHLKPAIKTKAIICKLCSKINASLRQLLITIIFINIKITEMLKIIA